jgi:signal transduction histidine kinase
LIKAASVNLSRYTPDGFNVTMAGWSLRDIHIPVGLRFPLSPDTIGGEIVRTGGPVRKDSWEDAQSDLARLVRERGVRSSVGAPVIVEGRLWGALVAATDREDGLPGGTETQLARFTDLVATAISNTESRDGLRKLAVEQAALLRVAGLVAREAPPAELWAAVCAEVAQVFDLPWVELARYDGDDSATVIGAAGHHPFSVGTRWTLDGPSVMQLVRSSGRPSRIDDYRELAGTIADVARAGGIRGAIGAPVVVDGATWGAFVAIATEERGAEIPPGAEERLGVFTELIAAAISNVEAHDDLRNLANEQGALRRVATLVAQGAGRDELFSAVATEAAHLLHVSGAVLDRFEPDRTAITLAASYEASWTEAQGVLEVGVRWPPDEGSLAAMLVGTGRAARVDDPADTGGGIAERWQAAGIGSAVAAPIVVGGQLWGAIRVFARRGARLPGDTEQRLAAFTELVATSVSNASARDDLIASRARIVAAGDDARRRIERDLHDGTQQRLIALGLDLQRIRATVVEDPAEAAAGLSHMEDDLQLLLEEIRELSSNLHPPLLSRRGFVPALRALARRSSIPVEIDVELRERPPAAIETALYYVASEALTNAIKHSQASAISVSVETDHVGWPFGIGLDGRRGVGQLYATISDDGVGGADVTTGSGLSGLADRIDALGGRFSIDSPAGLGTRISIVLPLDH